jgi:hypothetical protein
MQGDDDERPLVGLPWHDLDLDRNSAPVGSPNLHVHVTADLPSFARARPLATQAVDECLLTLDLQQVHGLTHQVLGLVSQQLAQRPVGHEDGLVRVHDDAGPRDGVHHLPERVQGREVRGLLVHPDPPRFAAPPASQ